jgi:hypothetical protein
MAMLGENGEDAAHEVLPPGSTNIVKIGNGWYKFEWENKKFLARVLYQVYDLVFYEPILKQIVQICDSSVVVSA